MIINNAIYLLKGNIVNDGSYNVQEKSLKLCTLDNSVLYISMNKI